MVNKEKEEWKEGEPTAMNIVHQLGDLLYENLPPDIAHKYFVTARQNTNDRAIDFAQQLIKDLLYKEREKITKYLEYENSFDEKQTDKFCKGALSARKKTIDFITSLNTK